MFGFCYFGLSFHVPVPNQFKYSSFIICFNVWEGQFLLHLGSFFRIFLVILGCLFFQMNCRVACIIFFLFFFFNIIFFFKIVKQNDHLYSDFQIPENLGKLQFGLSTTARFSHLSTKEFRAFLSLSFSPSLPPFHPALSLSPSSSDALELEEFLGSTDAGLRGNCLCLPFCNA